MTEAFERHVNVRWRDTDAIGHVNHVVFLTYLEEARDALYEHVLGSEPIYVVARIEIDFRAEVRHADRRVTVRIEVERVGTASLTTRETIVGPSGQVVARAQVITVRWDADRREPVPFSETERARLAVYPISAGTGPPGGSQVKLRGRRLRHRHGTDIPEQT
jgi:acyl-CoA thioester hydrolase